VLVSGIAHTFNNLMAAIVAEADVALWELPAGSAGCGNAERISSIAMRVADFVSLLRAYAGSAPLGPVLPIDVSRLVRETLQLVKATASKNVVFSAMLAEKLPVIRADVSQMRQVVMNILTNACESLSGMQGSVHVSTSSVHVSADGAGGSPTSVPPGQYVQLCVTDNGCGIALQYQTQIFDPFYTTKFLGRGLGLAAVQGIVRNLGGGIRVQSTPGRGSTFEILLPCIAAVNSGISEQL